MNTKTNSGIYQKVIECVCKEYENIREIIYNKINELCSEHGISADEVNLYIFMFVMLRTQFGYTCSLERIYFHNFFSIKIVLL